MLYLLFATGTRPDRCEVIEWVESQPSIAISHDDHQSDVPHARDAKPSSPSMELLCNGLTYDLSGLAPDPPVAFSQIEHHFDLAILPRADAFEAVALGVGAHLAGSANSQPVIRTMVKLACAASRHFGDCIGVGWGPANTAIGRKFFESAASAWLEGGPFPALGFTAFVETGEKALQTTGLSFWIGQELRIDQSIGADRVAATRLGIRIVNHLVLIGGIAADDHVLAPDGSRLALRLSDDAKLVTVQRE